MKDLSRLQSAVFIAGGLMMVVGAGCFVFMLWQKVVCWVFLAGAVAFATLQIYQSYEGNDVVVTRLKKIMTAADLLFVLSGIFMADTAYQFFRPAFSDYTVYFQYVYNKWVLLLLVAAVLEVYTMHRISAELRKD